MYNRYIPQPDGSYRRNRIQDAPSSPPPRPEPRHEAPRRPEPPQEECSHEPERQPPCQNQQPCAHMRPPCRQPSPPPRQKQTTSSPLGVGSFLRQLLPKDFCTEDLLIVLLLLLMAGDCQEDQNSALLTLALYLFM